MTGSVVGSMKSRMWAGSVGVQKVRSVLRACKEYSELSLLEVLGTKFIVCL